ncbi:MAG: H4MPT-linked C1 transfer pathway protein [Planctomycetales bacterium]|nr:H4MPT-linked C1 transfer pathway protein [Planctomycetales bacterium]
MDWLGLDIGGANLKVADGGQFARTRPFALWRQPQQLAAELQRLLQEAPACRQLAVTMTGELADCYASKAEGVVAIVEAAVRAAPSRQVAIYSHEGRFLSADQAVGQPDLVAAANWHALATFAARHVAADGLLIDVGSTTMDVVRLVEGRPAPAGRTDTQRLLAGELIYSGVGRTPLAMLVEVLPWRGAECPVARESFATTLDVYLMRGELAEESTNTDTADGRPATRAAAQARLARMICADPAEVTEADALGFADAVAARQRAALEQAVRRVAGRARGGPQQMVVSGQGEFLARQAAAQAFPQAGLVSLADRAGAAISLCAAAHAVAVLAEEQDG